MTDPLWLVGAMDAIQRILAASVKVHRARTHRIVRTAFDHLTDLAWKEIQASTPRLRSLTARAGTPIRELKQFQEFVKRNFMELAYCEGIAVCTKHFVFSKLPMFSSKVSERFKISPDPISKDGRGTLPQFSPTGESISYSAQASELWISDGSSLTLAAETLENAFRWWCQFIDEMSISNE